jgi:GNAT superfamily N-acetyltransferase
MPIPTRIEGFTIRHAEEKDTPLILWSIKELAVYEKLIHVCVATEELIRTHLFGEKPMAEVVIGEDQGNPVGFALFFNSFSTFLGKPGIYMEDLYVVTEERGKGFGKCLLSYLAKLTVERDYGRLEWAVLDWNEPSIGFYDSIGAKSMKEWVINRMDGRELANLADQF